MVSDRRLRAALLATLGFAAVLGAVGWAVSTVTPVAGPDASGWPNVAMGVAAVAGFLAILLRLSASAGLASAILLPTLGAVAAFLVVGGVLHGLGGGDPLRGPAFVLTQFGHPGRYIVAILSILASAVFRKGTSPHRPGHSRRVG